MVVLVGVGFITTTADSCRHAWTFTDDHGACAACGVSEPALLAARPVRPWHEIAPEDAINIELPRPDIAGPVNEQGEPCPWPWEPQQLVGVPLGQYHCGYCGAMVMAGLPHIDYAEGELGEIPPVAGGGTGEPVGILDAPVDAGGA